jgi:hypothetical protein
MKIIFIADYYYYKKATGKTSFNFINYIADNSDHYIKIFYTDYNEYLSYNEILEINPDLIIVFEINAFQENTKKFKFIYSLNKPVYVFLDDSYYISSLTHNCEYMNLCNGIIFWYNNERINNSYKIKYPNKKILNFNSRYVNTNIYKDYKLDKKYDILLYGTRNFLYNYKNEELETIQNYIKKYEEKTNIIVNEKFNFYPLRNKLENIIIKLQNKYNIKILQEFTIDEAIFVNEELSKLINESYLTIACPSIADVLLHKHLEITASKSVILGNYPSDYKDLFEGNIIEVNEFMTEDEIINIIDNALSNKDKLNEMSERLYNKVHNEHNLEKAQESFNNVIEDILH